MKELRAYRERLLEQAAGQPGRIRLQLEKASEEGLHSPLEDGGWSPHQIAVHLRDVEQKAFLPRIQSMLQEEKPELAYFDEGGWMERHYDQGEPPEEILDSFEQARRTVIELLRAADPQGWSRIGRHPTQGIRTVQWWFEYSVQHGEEHLRQLTGA
ncbi:MAG: DinB family protein [Anaerolineales bacterium]|jgi:hypothetical protein